MKYREAVRFLTRRGWEHVRSNGSHHQFKHPDREGTLTVTGRRSSEEVTRDVKKLIEQMKAEEDNTR